MFDPKDHLIKVQGGRMYLPVAARIVWFRSEHPDWSIVTQIIESEAEFSVFRATITDETGKIISTATKQEDKKGFFDHLEKAETGSIGRALAFAGYGTIWATEAFQEGKSESENPADGPQRVNAPNTATNRPEAPVRPSGEPGTATLKDYRNAITKIFSKPIASNEETVLLNHLLGKKDLNAHVASATSSELFLAVSAIRVMDADTLNQTIDAALLKEIAQVEQEAGKG